MTPESSICPFCNAALPPLTAAPIVEKLACPRCGEMVPASRWRVDATAIRAGEPSPPAPLQAGEGRKAANRKTAFIMLGIMGVMAVIALSYAFWTLKERQDRHPWMPPKKPEPITFRRPLELTGLGYLPKDCKLVAALQVAEMMQDEPAGKKLLAEPRPELLDWPLKHVTRTSGLTLEEIDHVVLGTADLKQIVMVVKARAKVSLEKLADNRPVKSSKRDERPVYEFELPNVGNAVVWCVADDTLVYVIFSTKLDGLSATVRPVKETLPPALFDAVNERLPKQCFVWAAGRVDQLGPALVFLPLMMGAKTDLSFLKDTKTIALGMTPHEGMTLVGEFHMNDAKAAAKLKTRLDETKLDGAKSQTAKVTPADQPQQWVSWQVRGDAAMVRAWLGEGKDRK